MQRLSRRQVLKGLGLGTGLVAIIGLAGCTSLIRVESEDANPGEVAALDVRLSKVDKDLMQAALEAWGKVLRVENGLDKVSPAEMVQRLAVAKGLAKRVLDNMDQTGFSAAMDDAIRSAPDFGTVPDRTRERYVMPYISDVYTPNQLSVLEEALKHPIRLEPFKQEIMADGGWSKHLRKTLGLDLAGILQGQSCNRCNGGALMVAGFVAVITEDAWLAINVFAYLAGLCESTNC